MSRWSYFSIFVSNTAKFETSVLSRKFVVARRSGEMAKRRGKSSPQTVLMEKFVILRRRRVSSKCTLKTIRYARLHVVHRIIIIIIHNNNVYFTFLYDVIMYFCRCNMPAVWFIYFFFFYTSRADFWHLPANKRREIFLVIIVKKEIVFLSLLLLLCFFLSRKIIFLSTLRTPRSHYTDGDNNIIIYYSNK